MVATVERVVKGEHPRALRPKGPVVQGQCPGQCPGEDTVGLQGPGGPRGGPVGSGAGVNVFKRFSHVFSQILLEENLLVLLRE